MYIFKVLEDLPTVPDKFISEAYDIIKNPTEDVTPNKLRPDYIVRQLEKDGKTVPSTRTFRYPMSEEYQQWVRENIVEQWTETTISVTPASIGPHMGAHTDFSNNYRIMYVLETGGENCRTVYYQEKGEPYHRPGRKWINIDNFDRLEEKESIQMPVGKWTYTKTQYLHSVEDITSDRVVLHIALLEDDKIKSKMHQQALLESR